MRKDYLSDHLKKCGLREILPIQQKSDTDFSVTEDWTTQEGILLPSSSSLSLHSDCADPVDFFLDFPDRDISLQATTSTSVDAPHQTLSCGYTHILADPSESVIYRATLVEKSLIIGDTTVHAHLTPLMAQTVIKWESESNQ